MKLHVPFAVLSVSGYYRHSAWGYGILSPTHPNCKQ